MPNKQGKINSPVSNLETFKTNLSCQGNPGTPRGLGLNYNLEAALAFLSGPRPGEIQCLGELAPRCVHQESGWTCGLALPGLPGTCQLDAPAGVFQTVFPGTLDWNGSSFTVPCGDPGVLRSQIHCTPPPLLGSERLSSPWPYFRPA